MDNWYEADETWVRIGFKSREEYAAWMVAPGQFHAGVHEDVVSAYRTAAHLMALAWYHYPMYDEALKKLTAIVEMGIKLRCQQVGISLTRGKSETDKRLVDLIDELCARPEATELKWRLHTARNIRNRQAHPTHQSFGGIAVSIGVKPLIELLNMLFVDLPDSSDSQPDS